MFDFLRRRRMDRQFRAVLGPYTERLAYADLEKNIATKYAIPMAFGTTVRTTGIPVTPLPEGYAAEDYEHDAFKAARGVLARNVRFNKGGELQRLPSASDHEAVTAALWLQYSEGFHARRQEVLDARERFRVHGKLMPSKVREYYDLVRETCFLRLASQALSYNRDLRVEEAEKEPSPAPKADLEF